MSSRCLQYIGRIMFTKYILYSYVRIKETRFLFDTIVAPFIIEKFRFILYSVGSHDILIRCYMSYDRLCLTVLLLFVWIT